MLKNPLVVNIASTIYQHMNVQGQDSFKKNIILTSSLININVTAYPNSLTPLFVHKNVQIILWHCLGP